MEGKEMGIPIQEVKPVEELNLLLRKWVVLLLFGILGGLVGLGVSLLLPPRYEARATLQISLDLPQTQVYTDAQTDYILNSVIHVVDSTALLQELAAGYQSEGEQVRVSDFTLERRQSLWDLVVRNPDPVLAAELANAWLDQSAARLEETHRHAVQAAELALELDLLQGCLGDAVHPLCESVSDMAALESVIDGLSELYQQEERASQGLNPSLTWLVESRASIPSIPAARQRGALTLAGMGIGLLLTLPILRILFRSRR
jgi:uncharacterized protein involved in exopolysaccharide biosynthesis